MCLYKLEDNDMFKIAVCDNDQIYLAKINIALKSNLSVAGIDCCIDLCSCGAELLDFDTLLSYDAIFLSAKLRTTNGINIATYLRKLGYANIIVFVTSCENYATRAYHVDAFRFILKANLKEELAECVEAIIQKLGLKQIVVSDSDIKVKDLLYAESDRHKIILHFVCGKTLKMRGKLTDFERRINANDMLRVHQSYLVNMNYIQSIRCCQITLINKEIIPVPKSKYRLVKNKISVFRCRLAK